MSGKLFNFLCSQLERKNSRRTIDLSVNLIFRRIHVYQNGHVPIYRFPSVFFLYFFSKGVFYVDKWHNISNRTGLEPVSALNFLLCFFLFISFRNIYFCSRFWSQIIHSIIIFIPNNITATFSIGIIICAA